jgi:hypothetical protein
MIAAFHPYRTVDIPFVPVLLSVPGEKLSVTGEKLGRRAERSNAGDRWGC